MSCVKDCQGCCRDVRPQPCDRGSVDDATMVQDGREPTVPVVTDLRSFIAGLRLGAAMGAQEAAYSTYAGNIAAASTVKPDLTDLDHRPVTRWHE